MHAGVEQHHPVAGGDRPRVSVGDAGPRERQAQAKDAGEHTLAPPELAFTDSLRHRRGDYSQRSRARLLGQFGVRCRTPTSDRARRGGQRLRSKGDGMVDGDGSPPIAGASRPTRRPPRCRKRPRTSTRRRRARGALGQRDGGCGAPLLRGDRRARRGRRGGVVGAGRARERARPGGRDRAGGRACVHRRADRGDAGHEDGGCGNHHRERAVRGAVADHGNVRGPRLDERRGAPPATRCSSKASTC